MSVRDYQFRSLLNNSDVAGEEQSLQQSIPLVQSHPGYESVNSSDDEFDNLPQATEKYEKSWFDYFQPIFGLLMVGMVIFSLHTLYLALTGELPNLKELAINQKKFVYNNGTNHFAPTVIMISLDGFRADYLDRNITPNLNSLGNQGVKAKHMFPSFPSITFPNHYTLATGLLPDSHGIVGNTFLDPETNQTFNYKTKLSNSESYWWGGEPIWITAEMQGQHSAVHMWPGSEATHSSLKSTYSEPFNANFKLSQKADQLLGWLDLPDLLRPTYLGAYMFDVDTNGHDHGPNSKETNDAIQRIDNVIGKLISGLADRNLTQLVNVVIVSDHGMTEIHKNNTIYLDDIIDMKKIKAHHIFPLGGLIPNSPSDIQPLYQQLKAAANKTDNWDVYLRSDIPKRFLYGQNTRVPDILCVQKAGFDFATRDKSFTLFEQYDEVRGLHGYDNLHPDMRAIFLANGPGFETNRIVEPFQNIEVYGIVAKLLGLEPAANNGTKSFLDKFPLALTSL